MFMGEYAHNIDRKGRLIMPAKFREELGEHVVVNRGLDGCLYVYTVEQWQAVYEKLSTLKKEKYFRTWITRILINECNGILRKRKNVIPYEEYMDNMRLTEEDRYSHLYMAIMELPEDLRILVTLYYLEGFSQKEISEALDIPEGTIKSRLSRAREFLKVQLSEEEKRPATGKNSKQLKRITGKGKMSC